MLRESSFYFSSLKVAMNQPALSKLGFFKQPGIMLVKNYKSESLWKLFIELQMSYFCEWVCFSIFSKRSFSIFTTGLCSFICFVAWFVCFKQTSFPVVESVSSNLPSQSRSPGSCFTTVLIYCLKHMKEYLNTLSFLAG